MNLNSMQDQCNDLIPKEFFLKKSEIHYDPFMKYKKQKNIVKNEYVNKDDLTETGMTVIR